MLLSEFLKQGITRLESLYSSAEARNIILMLCEDRIGTKNYTHIVEPKYEVPEKALPGLEKDLERLANAEPIQYVLGYAYFMDFKFKVTPSVLIPRPETELLVNEAVKIANIMRRARIPFGKNAEPVRILDLCTGSGCIAWSVALNVPSAEVTAVDISDPALDVARSQDFSSLLKEREAVAPKFIHADVLDLSEIDKFSEFDLILSNPPYIKDSEKAQMRKNVLDYEPDTALFVSDEDPLVFYEAIAEWSSKLLSKDGVCLSEINETLGEKTAQVFRKAGFANTSIMKDFFDKDRFVIYSRR